MIKIVAALAAVAMVCAATASAAKVSVSPAFFLTANVPAGWSMMERVEADVEVPVVFAIKLRNVDELHRHIDEISDPTHERWGRHMTVDEINEVTSDWEATGRVYAWIMSRGVPATAVTLSRGGDFVRVTLPAAQAERLLDASLHRFRHDVSGAEAIRTPVYRLPGSIRNLVDFVSVSTLFPTVRPSNPTVHEVPLAAEGEPIPAGYMTPQVYAKGYGMDDLTVATEQATQSVYENLGQSYDENDLAGFQEQFGLPRQQVAKVIGPNTPSACAENANNCIEALLDVEYIMALAQGSPTTYWSLPNGQQPFLDWITAVAADDDAPLVHSISYGDVEVMGDPDVFRRFCDEVGKLGARGISVFVASGDDGVANFPARQDPSKCGFSPSFPATCPYVTAVGATQGVEDGSAEIACSSDTGGGITTGGGFSTVFDQPKYQADAVQKYLQGAPNLPPTSDFASTGRGYPDIASAGHNFVTYIGGKLSAGSGTSASTPSVAAMITLVNGLRIEQGKAALGFLNPTLYQLASSNPSVYNDITSGNNRCCAGGPQGGQGAAVCCDNGFYCTSGWDPLTGHGSLNFQELKTALLALP